MESKRQQKYAKLIKEEMASIFMKEGKKIFGDAFITISDVAVTPDLGLAKIYVSLQFITNRTEIVDAMNNEQKFFRGLLGSKIRKVARTIPELKFYEDNTLDEASRIDEVLKGLNIPPAEDED